MGVQESVESTKIRREEIGDLPKFFEVHRRDRRRFTEITEKARLLIKVITRSGACWEAVGRSSSESSPEQDSTFAVKNLLRMCFGYVVHL